jgi:hypothetical protein
MTTETIDLIKDIINVIILPILGGLGVLMNHCITLIKNVIETNTSFKLDIQSILQDIKTIKKDVDELKLSKETSKEEINNLKLMYLELKIKLENIIDK